MGGIFYLGGDPLFFWFSRWVVLTKLRSSVRTLHFSGSTVGLCERNF